MKVIKPITKMFFLHIFLLQIASDPSLVFINCKMQIVRHFVKTVKNMERLHQGEKMASKGVIGLSES